LGGDDGAPDRGAYAAALKRRPPSSVRHPPNVGRFVEP
jgi:hypothetical protein